MSAGPESEDPDVPEWMLGAGVLFGLNRIQTRWKLLALHRKWRSFRRELEPASRRFEHQICGECGALQPHEAKICSSCGEKLASAPARFLKTLGLSMPTFLSVSSLLWLAFIAIYFRMMVEWKGQGLMTWDAEALIAHGALWPPAFWEGQYWRIGTANFLHIGWLHVFFNTAGLSQVGPAIEDVYGRGRMVFFFVLTGVLAMLASAIFNPGALTAGASGALMGLIGVAAGWGHRSKTTHGRNVRDQMIKWGVYTMLFGLVMNANHVAHAAGFVAGAVIGYAYPTHTLEKTKGSAVSIGLGIIGGLTCGVLVLLALVPPGSSRELAAGFRKPKFLDEGVSSEREFRVAIANACRLRDKGDVAGAIRELERAGGTEDLTEHELEDTCVFLEHMKKECVRYREGGLDAVYPMETRGDAHQVKAISDYYRLWCTEKGRRPTARARQTQTRGVRTPAMKTIHLSVFLVLGALAACGDDAAGTDGDGGSGSTDDDDGSEKTSSTTSGAGGDATGSGGSTGSGMIDDRLFPAEVGRIWTYDVQSTYPSCPSGQRTSEILEAVTVDGKSAYRTTGICGFETAITVTGDVVESKYESYPWFRMLDEPVQDGHTWTTTNGAATFDMHYESVGSVTTPAGTFDDCWRVVQDVSYQQDWTYCRGVGPVSSTLVDLSGGTIMYELTAKNF